MTDNKRNNALSLVQVICSLLIVNYHTNVFEIPKLELIAKGGFLMNTVFVFLSGYMLTKSFSKNDSASFKNFITARARRIYPSFYITLTLILAYSIFSGTLADLASYFYWYTGFGYYNPDNTVFASTHLWFVSVILTCYLLFIPTYRLIKKYKLLLPAILILIFIMLMIFWVPAEKRYTIISNNILYRFLYHYIVFSLSMYWNLSGKRIENLNFARFAGFLVATAGYFTFVNNKEFAYLAIISAVFFSVLFVPIIYNSAGFFERYFKPIFSLAPYTYELYLIHFPVIMVLDEYFHGSPLAYVLAFAISVPFAVVIGKLSGLIMKPLIKKNMQRG